MTIPESNGLCEIQEGCWLAGKLNGYATITYVYLLSINL